MEPLKEQLDKAHSEIARLQATNAVLSQAIAQRDAELRALRQSSSVADKSAIDDPIDERLLDALRDALPSLRRLLDEAGHL